MVGLGQEGSLERAKQFYLKLPLTLIITTDGDCSHEIKRCLLLGRKVMTITDSILKSKTSLCQQSYGFSSGHVWMWKLDHKESWVLKNWCFWTAVLENTLESTLDCKEIKSVNPKGNQPWIFIGRTEAETPILWPHEANCLMTRQSHCWAYTPRKPELRHVYPNVHRSTVCNSQDMEAT